MSKKQSTSRIAVSEITVFKTDDDSTIRVKRTLDDEYYIETDDVVVYIQDRELVSALCSALSELMEQ